MRQVRLGQTDLQVSMIAFGTWAFGGDWGAADLQESKDAIHRALELGINLFDTAQGYGFGAAEQLLGEALRERTSREEVIIATKGGLRMDGDRLLRDSQRDAPTTSKQVGQVRANYTEGSRTIVGGTTAKKATEAALAAYPGGVVDRVVKLSDGEYEVHYIGVNWPHHNFVKQNCKVVGAK